MATVTDVKTCTVTTCAYNNEGCTAEAVTITDSGCATFISLDAHGGLPTAEAHVGACQRANCKFNQDLLCTASAITVGDSEACMTFEAR